MKKQIKKVQDYFKNKMLSNEFEITKIEEYTLDLIIDSEYKFTIGTGNIDIPTSRRPYIGTLSFMDIELSDEESEILNGLLLPAINRFRKETLLAKKKKELEQLQNELANVS
jgi:hypothetical protein